MNKFLRGHPVQMRVVDELVHVVSSSSSFYRRYVYLYSLRRGGTRDNRTTPSTWFLSDDDSYGPFFGWLVG